MGASSYQSSFGGECPSQVSHGMVRHVVEDDVVELPGLREVFLV